MAINQAELFNNVPDEQIHMNEYDLSFDNTLTTEVGRLTPVFCRRVLPGERWSMNIDMFARLMPLLSPVFGKMDLYAHAFYCTNRSLSNIWENYIRAGEDGESIFEPDLLAVTNVHGRGDVTGMDVDESSSIIANLSGFDSLQQIARKYEEDASIRPAFTHGSLFDYLNLGSWYSSQEVINAINKNDTYPVGYLLYPFDYSLLPFKAYQAIWSEYYADANVMTFDGIVNSNGEDTISWDFLKSLHTVHLEPYSNARLIYLSSDGFNLSSDQDDTSVLRNLFTTRRRCFAKDYFTSSLPEPQRGPDVLIPIDAEITLSNKFGAGEEPTYFGEYSRGIFVPDLGGKGFIEEFFNQNAKSTSLGPVYNASLNGSDFSQLNVYNADQLRAELGSLSATITDLRTAIKLQEFYEASARYGNRYKEFIYGHFGSMIPDDQLTRPWYLGGCKVPITISDVEQTSPDGSKAGVYGVGSLAGKGICATNDDGFLFNRTFDDYGLIMVILSIRPHNYYKNTVFKEWTITDRLDEYWRKLQGVGEEEVLTYELTGFTTTSSKVNDSVYDEFGYQMRYSNYKFNNDEVHGDFKGDLSYWTMVRDFRNGVTLSPEFLEIHPREFNHIFQYTGLDTDHFLIQTHLNIIRETPMDIYSVPKI